MENEKINKRLIRGLRSRLKLTESQATDEEIIKETAGTLPRSLANIRIKPEDPEEFEIVECQCCLTDGHFTELEYLISKLETLE